MTRTRTIFIAFLALALLPSEANAASAVSLHIAAPDIIAHAGDTILIPLTIHVPEAESINALEASVSVAGARIVGVNTGHSIFTLWLQKPSFTDTNLSFVGGTPSSVYGPTLNLVTLALELNTPSATIRIEKATAYAGDGKGTLIVVSSASRTIIAAAPSGAAINEQSAFLTKDTEPPAQFDIQVGKDPSVFDGQYFISFYTTDAGSGVARYEVQEGSALTQVFGNTYVIKDQTLQTPLTVRAIDNAGNVKAEKLQAPFPWLPVATAVVLIIFIAGIAFLVRRRLS